MARPRNPKPNRRLFFDVGHGGGYDSGAIAYNNRTELSYNIEVVSGITQVMRKLMEDEYTNPIPVYEGVYGIPVGYVSDFPITVDSQDWNLNKTINEVNKYAQPNDLLISVHFNFNSERATGTEIFVNQHTSEDNKALAASIVNITANSLGLKVRGSTNRFPYKYENESAVKTLGILRFTKPKAMLLEVCFLNKHDLDLYEKNKSVLFNTLGKFLYDEIFGRND